MALACDSHRLPDIKYCIVQNQYKNSFIHLKPHKIIFILLFIFTFSDIPLIFNIQCAIVKSVLSVMLFRNIELYSLLL